MPTVAELQAELALDLEDAEAAYQDALASNPSHPVPKICVIPDFPPGATDAQKVRALQCALDMVARYLTCIEGDESQWASCVAQTCSDFVACWNGAFATL